MESTRAAYMTVDSGKLGCELNHRKAWEWLAEHGKGDWAVVLEDDAEPVPNFRIHLDKALAHAPGPIVSLYLGRCRPGYAQSAIRELMADLDSRSTKPSFITTNHLLHAVGLAVRTEVIRPMLEGISQVPYALLPVDEGIGQWAQAHGHTVAYTLPSLVNHAHGPTVIAEHHDGQDRTAERRAWISQERAGAWDGESVALTLPPTPHEEP